MRRLSAVLALTLLLHSGCGSETPDSTISAPEPKAEIAWFEGEVDQAFALAKEQNKPLFLYWGAVWCPPCHYLKTKIFSRPELVAQSRAFIPVYLDGDTERAQILGERFGTVGYPTVILFNPAGQEITRLPSTLPVGRYQEVLEQAMSRMRPIRQILADVQTVGPSQADSIDLNLLAFYSWGQDHEVQIPQDERLATFRTLYEDTPETSAAERSRFLGLYLGELLRAGRDGSPAISPLDSERRAALHEAVLGILADPDLRAINLELVLYMSRETVELLHPEPSAERASLTAAWKDAAQALEDDTSLTLDDRLSALLPRIWLTRMELEAETADGAPDGEQAALPEELRQHVRERIAWAGETVSGESELQAVMNTMAGLLSEASLTSEAESLLTDRLSDTLAPYYYMSWLASLKQETGQPDEALELYRQAYDTAEGRYTRFRWGSTYLRQLMLLAPDDVATLEADSLEILSELLTREDAFAGGNHARLEQLASAYHRWNDDHRHDEIVDRLQQHVHAACDRYPEGDQESQRSRCRAFLEPAEIAAG